ncbi:MAG: Carbonic anhydrase, cadmium-binding protein [Candidatus Saccharibacteria bacterium]|nr:Carbonic anhydrase, cadmium-binding protein [Candidatus Saccharibacteria bacterium]
MEQEKDSMEMEDKPLVLEHATGLIEAAPHQQERRKEFVERLKSGEFYVTTPIDIAVGCIDGRGMVVVPNSAGGTESLFVADDLTTQRFRGEDGSTQSGYVHILNHLIANEELVGGHDDENASGDKSGCGANDRLADIYGVITSSSAAIRDLAGKLGVEVDDETHQLIVGRAGDRSSFSSGANLLKTLENIKIQQSDNVIIDHIAGSHNEVVIMINTVEGTTIDRAALKAEFGNDYQAFNVDVWSFAAGAELISRTAREVEQKVAAMVYYNIAAALVLCGPTMQIHVRS